jgi:hypothetical protein
MEFRSRLDHPDVIFKSADGFDFALHSALLQVRWPAFKQNSDASLRSLSSLRSSVITSVLEFLYGGLPVQECMRETFHLLDLPFPSADPSAPYKDAMRRLFTSASKSDFTIDSCGRKFPVHRFILAIRSSYFASLFESGLQESVSGVLSDRSAPKASSMQAFLEYLYFGDCEFPDVEDVFIFLELCSKYGIIEGYRGEHAEFVMGKILRNHAGRLPEILARARSSGRQCLAELIEACELSN